MNPASFLKKEDCEVARTAENLIAWIESVHAQYDEVKSYAGIEEKVVKAFYEEIVPLGVLARHKYRERPGLYLRPKIGDQNFDAEIIDTSAGKESITPIEFVSTYRDDKLALREEYRVQHGAVFMTGAVWRDGTKASGGQVQVFPDFEEHQDRIDELVVSAAERMADKIRKPYSADTIIAVVFDDSLLNPEDLPRLQLYFQKLSKLGLRKFSGVFILGVSGKTFLEFGETLPLSPKKEPAPCRGISYAGS